MRILEHETELKTSQPITISVASESKKESTQQLPIHPHDSIPAYFYSQAPLQNGSGYSFFERIPIVIQRILGIIKSIRNTFGPFYSSTSAFIKENQNQASYHSVTKTIDQKESNIIKIDTFFESVGVEKLESSITVTPQIDQTSQEKPAEIQLLDTVPAELDVAPPSIIEQLEHVLPVWSEIILNDRAAYINYANIWLETKPAKRFSIETAVENYHISYQKSLLEEERIQEYTEKAGNTKAHTTHNPLEGVYVSALLPHTVVIPSTINTEDDGKRPVSQKNTEHSVEATLEMLQEIRSIFTGFNINTFKKLRSELLRKAQDYFNNPPSRKRKDLAYTTDYDLLRTPQTLSFAKYKKHIPQELQLILEIDLKNTKEYDQGRQIVWDWYKHHQSDPTSDLKPLVEYSVTYLKTSALINNRYSQALESALKNLIAIDRLENKVRKNID